MEKNMKNIAIYLPQFHEIPENNEWWGKGYTEWNTVKNARPYYKNHYQPQEPLNDNYYDLSDNTAKTWKWQAKLAKDNNIYGFCIYHYWFKDGKKMLYKPMEILRDNPDINIRYCICWANEPWRRTWYAGNSELLIPQEYGGKEEWLVHFDYLLSFFKDKRYICKDNKPVITIYRTAAIDDLKEMIEYWNELAISNGFDGIYLISERTAFTIDKRVELFDAFMNFEPAYTLHYGLPFQWQITRIIKGKIKRYCNNFFNTELLENKVSMKLIYKNMRWNNGYKEKKVYPGISPRWDNTPRKQNKGIVFTNSSPILFKKQVKIISQASNENDFLFINAWNEWGEGAYLEPDKKTKYDYLNVLKSIQEEDE